MQGVYLKFYLHENARHGSMLAYEWLLEEARRLGLPGGSAFRAIAGYGRHGVMREEHFFELAGDLPVEVGFVASQDAAEHFLDHLKSAALRVVYIKLPLEYGVVGGGS